MRKEIPFKERKIIFYDRDKGNFADTYHLSKNSAGAVDIITYQGLLTVDTIDTASTRFTIQSALSDAINHCYGADDYENNVRSLLKGTGVKVLDIHVENAVQELFEIPNKSLSTNVMKGDKDSLVIDENSNAKDIDKN